MNDRLAAHPQTPRAPDRDARLRIAVEEAGLATWDVDLATHASIWSDTLFRLLGYPVEGTGRASFEMWQSRLHPDDRDRVLAALERARQERTVYRCEHRVVRADDGEIVWLEPHGRFLYDADGRATHLVGVYLETTTRKQAEERLIQRDTQLHLATRLVGIGIFDHDHVHNRLYWSDRLREMHGMPADLVPDLTHLEAQLHPEDREVLRAAQAAAYDPLGSGRFSAEYRIFRNGEVRWIVGRAQTFFSGEGAQARPVRTLGAEYDVTERKRTELRLRDSETQLRQADQRKDAFLATLAHELRNPLAPIRTAAEMLALSNLRDEQLDWARGVIRRQVEHMARLLDDLLDVARITRGKLQLKKERVELGTIVDTAVEAARPLITAKKHGLVLELPPQLPTLDADPVRLAQVVSNLLTNAAKYTDGSGRIALTAQVDGAALRISVRDSGIGLSQAALAHIFEMFSQVHDEQNRAEGGLGIGLSLVKGLVELHGGSVEALSEGPGRGSEFVVTLPVGGSEAAPQPDVSPAQRVKRPSIGRKILVADDNQDAADALEILLCADGHEVRTAYGGHAAVALAKAFQPEIALLDIGMPDLNGYEVAKLLRQGSWSRNVQLIALTGWGQEEDKRRAVAAGFDHHLTKPVDLHRLETLLKR